MAYLAFIGVIILLIWLAKVSNRLAVIEKRLEVSSSGPQPMAFAAAAASAVAQPAPTPTAAAQPAPTAALKPAFAWDAKTAAGLLTKVGVVALLFGIGFFLKYAIDQGWITVWMRIILGFAVGGLLLILGELWKQKYSQYAQALVGGGLAILYFTVFAAYQFYSLMEQPVAFLIMAAITALGVFLSYRYASKALGALAVLGGYLSPLLIHSNRDQQAALFSYLTVLNVGVVMMLARRYWFELLYLALFGTAVNFGLWASYYSSSGNTLNSMIFLSLNLLVVFILSALMFRRQHQSQTMTSGIANYIGGFYFLCLTGFAIASAVLLYDHFHDYLAPVMLLGGVIAFITYAVIDRLEYSGVNYSLSLAGSVLLVAAVGWQFSHQTQNIYLVALAVAGVGIGLMQQRKDLRIWSLILMLGTAFKILWSDYDLANYHFLVNAKFGTELLAIFGLLFMAWAYGQRSLSEDEQRVPELARLVASGILWLGISMEIWTYYRAAGSENVRNLLLSVWWLAYAVVLALLGSMRRYADLRKAAAVLFTITILKVFLYDVQALELGYRIVSFITLGVILLAVSFGYQRNKEKIQKFWGGGAA